MNFFLIKNQLKILPMKNIPLTLSRLLFHLLSDISREC
jgi:hypothetical protein